MKHAALALFLALAACATVTVDQPQETQPVQERLVHGIGMALFTTLISLPFILLIH